MSETCAEIVPATAEAIFFEVPVGEKKMEKTVVGCMVMSVWCGKDTIFFDELSSGLGVCKFLIFRANGVL